MSRRCPTCGNTGHPARRCPRKGELAKKRAAIAMTGDPEEGEPHVPSKRAKRGAGAGAAAALIDPIQEAIARAARDDAARSKSDSGWVITC